LFVAIQLIIQIYT